MTAVGKIKEIDGARVVVSVNREGACGGNCASCGGCTGKAADVSASCNIDVSVGAVVEISSPSKYILLGLIAVFLLPVILPVAGIRNICRFRYNSRLGCGCYTFCCFRRFDNIYVTLRKLFEKDNTHCYKGAE